MKFLNNMKIGMRLNLILTAVMILIIAAFGFYTNSIQKKKIINDTDLRMAEQVNDLARLIEVNVANSRKQIKNILSSAVAIIERDGGLQRKGNEWSMKGMSLMTSSEYVDQLSAITGSTVSIFVRDDDGYVRISTTVADKNNQRAVGTRLDNNSEIVKAIESGQLYSGRTLLADTWFIASYAPLKKDGEVIGLVGVGVPEKDMNGLKEVFHAKKYFQSGYPFVVTKEGLCIIHPVSEGLQIASQEFFKQMINGGEQGKSYYSWQGKNKYQYFKYVPSIESYVSVSIYESELFVIITRVRNTIFIAILLGIGIFTLIILLISRSISDGLQKGVDLAKRISLGDLNTTIILDQKDEVGELVSALNNMVIKLRTIVSEIISGANNIAAASQQISSTSQQLSQGASEQASSVEEVSSTMEEMAGNISQNSDNARQTETIALSALKGMEVVAGRSGQAVEATKVISDKIMIINDIAFQTNILALNAAVEAARAGEQGRGFAVVAAEVRKLAERSKSAADEIVGIAHSSVELVEGAGSRLNEMLPEINKTTRLVQEIAASSLEQNNGSNQVNNALQQLNEITQENAAASEELATSAEELASQAEQLKEMILYFKVDDHHLEDVHGKKSQVIGKKPGKDTVRTVSQTPEKGFLQPRKDSKGITIKLGSTDDSEFQRF